MEPSTHEFFNIPKYRMYYNESKINRSDGVVLYISEDITETTEIIQINRLKIVNTKISLENNRNITLSSIYRSHDIHKTEFLMNFKTFVKINKKQKDNLIIGDSNFDILSQDVLII